MIRVLIEGLKGFLLYSDWFNAIQISYIYDNDCSYDSTIQKIVICMSNWIVPGHQKNMQSFIFNCKISDHLLQFRPASKKQFKNDVRTSFSCWIHIFAPFTDISSSFDLKNESHFSCNDNSVCLDLFVDRKIFWSKFHIIHDLSVPMHCTFSRLPYILRYLFSMSSEHLTFFTLYSTFFAGFRVSKRTPGRMNPKIFQKLCARSGNSVSNSSLFNYL